MSKAHTTLKTLPRPPVPWGSWAAAVIVLAILIWSALGTAASASDFITGMPQMFLYFGRLLPTSDAPWPLDYMPQVADRLIETIKIALAATAIGSGLALWFALVGTRPLAASRWSYNFWRGCLNLLRTIPDLVLASLAVAAFGLGPMPGLLALGLFSFGIVAKLLCDKVETVEPGALEAITAAGGTRLQKGVFAMLPQVAPDYVAYSLYAFEINVRVAVVLALVGAGGIGQILWRDINLMRYGHVGLVIAVTFVVVLAIDAVSGYLRSKLV